MQEKLEILKNRNGFIAALDQSGGSSKKTLANYGIEENSYNTEEEMFNLIHEMRKRIITSDSFNSSKILAVILFEHTMNNKIDHRYTVDYLWVEKKIVSFLKIDKGLAEEKDGVKLLKDIPHIEENLKIGLEKGIVGTKMRSVIYEPNKEGIKALVKQQFELGKIIASYGLIPIIEPEVDIYAIEKFGAEQILLEEIKEALQEYHYNLIFKFTLPEKANFYDELFKYPNVLKIVALSGGYSRKKANILLKENKKMIASFSRALLEDLNYKQNDQEFDDTLKNNIESIYDASVNKYGKDN